VRKYPGLNDLSAKPLHVWWDYIGIERTHVVIQPPSNLLTGRKAL
jgi:hypothetical protein